MQIQKLMSFLVASTLAMGLLVSGGFSANAATTPKFEIVRATENRIWRLNTETGEIAVCTLDEERLICASSTEATIPPQKSYAELETERAEQDRIAAVHREEKQKRQMQMVNRMIKLFQDFVASEDVPGVGPSNN